MDDGDVLVRNETYGQFARRGQAPTIADVAGALDLDAADIAASWRRLHDDHALVLDSATGELRMLNPFSTMPTAYRVRADER